MAFTNYGQSFIDWERPFLTRFLINADAKRGYTQINRNNNQSNIKNFYEDLISIDEPQATTPLLPVISQNMQAINPITKDYSTIGRTINANGIGGFDKETAQELLRKAELQDKISTASSIGSSLMSMADARQNYLNVKKTKVQYENQKKTIDANVANQEALMMDNYNERMASADALYAAKNVDISSGALTGLKQQGAMEMGKDIRSMHEQANINKLALDLDYAIKRRQAKQAEWDAYVTGAFNIGTSVANFAAGAI